MAHVSQDVTSQIRDATTGSDSINIAHKITGRVNVHGKDKTSEPSAGFEHITTTDRGYGDGPTGAITTNDQLEMMCGPLLNYKRMSHIASDGSLWHGTVLIVTKPLAQVSPYLEMKYVGRTNDIMPLTLDGAGGSREVLGKSVKISGLKLFEDPDKAFWRFPLDLPFQDHEATWEYKIQNVRSSSAKGMRTDNSKQFVVPAANESMRIMFHSCNGFSVGTDENAWSGPVLWADVLRLHNQKPIHVMLGGGDQIYNDGVRVEGPLKAWTDIGNPKKRREYPFPGKLRDACDKYYFDNYVKWFSTEPFASANCTIPQVNIWDDHDIIDGFGSYTDHFMQCPVFRGIGSVSMKYYLLFQHHIPPPASTYTTDASQTTRSTGPEGKNGPGPDPEQLKHSFVYREKDEDPSFIIGNRPGPYVEERSRSLWTQLGARIGLLGIDARTERTRHQVNYPDTYDLVFKRAESELAAHPELTHLIVLLGIPIAYPRLQWLENLFTSPIIGPIRFLNKRFGFAGGLFNHFDGQVDLLDDLDDHYTARQHKKERKYLVLRLQALAQTYDVRVTLLGGDVHLAALGRFYSNPKLNVPIENDHRYMANIISSAITNKPPPATVANLLARRNFIHHLDHSTDETLMNVFDKDPGAVQITKNFNQCTMPSRNFALITENSPNRSQTNGWANGHVTNDGPQISAHHAKDGHSPLHEGEEGAGTKHPTASGLSRGSLIGGLDVAFRVEMDRSDREGKTNGYGFTIPMLSLSESKPLVNSQV